MIEHYPILLLVIPLVSAFVVGLVGLYRPTWCGNLTVLGLGFTLVVAGALLRRLMLAGPISYRLGGWAPPFGIEYVVDYLNIIVLLAIALVALLSAMYGRHLIALHYPDQAPQFYSLFLLLVCGLLGITITNDAFNLYVLLEISSLSSYALLALSKRRSLMATFQYLIAGTVGASFLLLGVGYLYIMTGTLNMTDLAARLPELYDSPSVRVAFVLLLMGAWIKMAFFPLHAWLPGAYANAADPVSTLIAPLMTKVAVYVMMRLMFTVFTPAYAFDFLHWEHIVVWMATIAIIAGSSFALMQTRLKKVLTYLIVAEVGYMVGGVWLANGAGITGAVFHVFNDALMTLCLFLFAGIIIHKTGGQRYSDLNGAFKRMPLTMLGFTVAALSMIGVPPTCGFFSKVYLIIGAVGAGHWHFVVALLVSSLVNAILFFRMIEHAWFRKSERPAPKGRWDEAPAGMLVPLLATAVAILYVGVNAATIVSDIVRHAVPPGVRW